MPDFDPTDHEQVRRYQEEEARSVDDEIVRLMARIIKHPKRSTETKDLARTVLEETLKGEGV